MVARRCLCLELLLQRLGLEVDDEDPVEEREGVRVAWLARVPDLGLGEALLADERAFLERRVDDLTAEEVDEIEGRVVGALVLLWALSRIGELPSSKMLGDATRIFATYGILGDGSITAAIATVESAKLRPEPQLLAARAAYEKENDEISQLALLALSSIV